MRRSLVAVLIVLAAVGLAGCSHWRTAPAAPGAEAASPSPVTAAEPAAAGAPTPTPDLALPPFFSSAQPESETSPGPGEGDGQVLYAPPARENPLAGDETPVVLNFEDAPLREVLITLAQLAEMDFILSPEVGGGKVTIMMSESRPLKRKDLFNVIMTILELNNLAAVDAGPYFKIVPSPQARTRPILTQIGKDPNMLARDDTMVTQIIPLEYLSPDDVLASVRPLISDDTSIITQPGSNLIIITGLQSSLKRVLAVIDMLDVDTAQPELEVFLVNHADASDIAGVLDRIFSSQAATAAPAAPGRGRQPAQPAAGQTAEVLIIPDARSNTLIVFAQRRDIEFIREILAMLDVDIYVSQKTYIYYVENGSATELAQLLSSVYQQRGTDQRRTVPPRQQGQPAAAPAGAGAGAGQLLGEVNIVADERTNALVIVTAPVNYPYILETIKKLDIMPKQVLIEVLIVDVTLQDENRFGVEWSLASQGEVDLGDNYYFDGTARQSLGIAENTLGFTYTLFEATRFRAFLQAYASSNRLEVLSSPHITVANNTEANIDVGSEIPVVTAETSTTDGGTITQNFNRTIEYRDTGILLAVTPHINENRFVSLEVSQEVSNVSSATLGGIDSPVIEKRKATTSVVIKDGQTLVIGGMIQRQHNPSSEGIPFLSKIPFLGWLFGRRTQADHASELLIFITPHVIASPEEGGTLTTDFRQRIKLDRLKDIDDFEYFRLREGGGS